MRIIAIIPARGGSKRIKDKNIVILGRSPLIEWTLHAATYSELITDIYVSTDDNFIKMAAESMGAVVIDRPAELCADDSPSEDAIIHVLENIDYEPDIIVMMQCTGPFRLPGQIDRGIQKLINSGADSLFFGTYLERWIWSNDGKKSLNYDYKNRQMTQEKQWEIVEGSDYVFLRESFIKHKNRLGGKIEHYIIDKICNFDINTEIDLGIAKAVYALNARRFYAKSLA